MQVQQPLHGAPLLEVLLAGRAAQLVVQHECDIALRAKIDAVNHAAQRNLLSVGEGVDHTARLVLIVQWLGNRAFVFVVSCAAERPLASVRLQPELLQVARLAPAEASRQSLRQRPQHFHLPVG